MNFWGRLALTCVAGGGVIIGTLALSPAGGLESPAPDYSLKELLNSRVENEDGQEIGTLEDVTIDPRTGKLDLALVKSKAALGSASKLHPLPARLLVRNTVKRGMVGVLVGTKRWAKSPALRPDELRKLAEPGVYQLVREFYVKPGSLHAIAQGAGQQTPPATPSPTGREQDAAGHLERGQTAPLLASDYLRKTVKTRQDQPIGDIEDLLVDTSGEKVILALFGAGRLLKSDEKFLAPFNLLSPGPKDVLLIDATRSMFEQAPPFRKDDWQSGASNPALKLCKYLPPD